MIFHHPEFLFDLRPHTCEEGRANCLSWGAFRQPSGARLRSISRSGTFGIARAHSCSSMQRGAVSSTVARAFSAHRRSPARPQVRNSAESQIASASVRGLSRTDMAVLASFISMQMLTAARCFSPLHRAILCPYEKTLLPQPFKSCPRTPTNRIPFPTPHTHETLAACSPASSLPLAECCLSPETTMAR